ncbi:MAG: peptidase S46 [Bacteroidetes bacterium GWF2_38_335]|nr:MAG: peptidase S46 [Bacteroidetes bacterium GWF2_38_335]OFY77965.1 MAG: peptidase S46 [Bacteroidetes bacterium RIFOXYA12_FULL_38_20]HBS86708.1 serine protease [Bacteroidales bacterium]
MKKIVLSFSLISLLLTSFIARADEGMWLPLFVNRLNYEDMQKKGCRLSAEEIYSVNKSSLKDAIVMFGGGCTGEVISDKGLILTNHHCGLGQIQAHSSPENDYLTNGFWAKNMAEELPNAGLTVSFLIRIEDVTSKVLDGIKEGISESERNKQIEEKCKAIEKEAKGDTHYKTQISAFFGGNEFYLFVYEIYQDVRMVGAPPWYIGKFGADTDNWMWPRHKGDFCLFRVYTAPDGKPAAYSKDNVPMKPKHHLPISIKGVKQGDYAMILGYPGRTERHMTSFGVKMLLDKTAPTIVSVRTKILEIMRQAMDEDDNVRIQYASKQARISNYWKYYIGQAKQLKRNRVLERKQELETKFDLWMRREDDRINEYGNCMRDIKSAYEILEKYEVATNYFNEAIYQGNELLRFALMSRRFQMAIESNFEKLNRETFLAERKKETEKFFKDYNLPADKKLFIAMMDMYSKNVEEQFQPAYFIKMKKKYKGDFAKYADYIYTESVFASNEKMMALIENPKSFSQDPGYLLMTAFVESYQQAAQLSSEADELLNKGNRLFIKGIREMMPDKKFAPDANSTMRLTYGTVMDYYPADAVHYDYFTTLKGVMEKEKPNDWEFHIGEKLKELYAKKEYGRYGKDGEMYVNFITNNDITGGNSGSPVIDGDGNLIGLAFDGNWEAMSGDIEFEPKLQRTICMDARYLLFVIDKVAGAQNIIDELDVVE